MLPTVPVSVWEQAAIVVIFALLLAGLGWVLTRIFSSAIEKTNASHARTVRDITAHYSSLVAKSNEQWQQYFDARSDANKAIYEHLSQKLESLIKADEKLYEEVNALANEFELHDQMERQALDDMANKRRLSKKA